MERVVAAVLGGGVVGATVRWAISETGWSTSTSLLVVNTLGCLLLGGVFAVWADREHPLRLALAVGLCGGLTTFSGLAVELAGRLDGGDVIGAIGLTAASLVFGVIAFVWGRAVLS